MQVHACLSRHYSGIIPILTFLHSEDHIWMWIESDHLYVLLRLVFHVTHQVNTMSKCILGVTLRLAFHIIH